MTTRRDPLMLLLIALLGLAWAGPASPAQREDFKLGDNHAFVIQPDKPAEVDGRKPWVWYAPTFHKRLPGQEEQWMFDRLDAAGIAVAGVDVGESMGNPEGRAVYQKLYVEMTEARGYSRAPVLLARSRGGLMLYNWAVEHPGCVGGVAGVYPVCNLLSYPGLERAAKAYAMTAEQLTAGLAEHNPVDRIAPLAEAGVAVLHLHGDADRVVPLETNSALLAQRYKALAGPIEVAVIRGGGHDVKRHWFESDKLVRFMIDKALTSRDSKKGKAEQAREGE